MQQSLVLIITAIQMIQTTRPIRTKLAVNIRFLRCQQAEDRTRQEVARFLGDATEQDIKDWETCKKVPTLEQIYKMAEYFRVSAATLIEVDLVEVSVQSRLNGKIVRTGILQELGDIPDKRKTIYTLKDKVNNLEQIIKHQKEEIKLLNEIVKKPRK